MVTVFGENRPFIGFLLMTVCIGLFCELIIRYSPTNQMKRFAAFWEIATLVALAFFVAGFLFAYPAAGLWLCGGLNQFTQFRDLGFNLVDFAFQFCKPFPFFDQDRRGGFG